MQDVAKNPDVDLCAVVCSTWKCVLQGTRDYNVGDGADVSVQAAVQQMGLQIPENFQARQINPERDIVCFDVVLVMDKFTAADVLREVSNRSCLSPMEPCHVIELVLLPKQIVGMRLPSVALSIDFNLTDMHGLHISFVLIAQSVSLLR